MKCWRNFYHWSPTLRQWLSKVQTYRIPNTTASSLFLLSKGHGMRDFIESSCEVVSTKGKNTSKYTEWVNTHDQHLHAYQQLQWGFRRGKGGRSSQASRYLLSGWSTAPFLLVCATVIYLMPTVFFLCDEQFCCYICVYNFNSSHVVASGLWINCKNQTLYFQFATRPPYILFAPPMFMPPLSDNSLYLWLWWSVASSGKHDHPSTPHLLFM